MLLVKYSGTKILLKLYLRRVYVERYKLQYRVHNQVQWMLNDRIIVSCVSYPLN